MIDAIQRQYTRFGIEHGDASGSIVADPDAVQSPPDGQWLITTGYVAG